MHAEPELAVDTSGMLAPQASTRAVTAAEVRALAPKLGDLARQLEGWRRAEPFSFFTLPFVTDATSIRQRARDLPEGNRCQRSSRLPRCALLSSELWPHWKAREARSARQ